jgi:outer membrane protein OmpA-like peptidoglycan-associated protein
MSKSENNGDEWLSISDLMSGLMLIFLLIAITFMIQVQKDKDKVYANLEELEAYKKRLEETLKDSKQKEARLYQSLKELEAYKKKLEEISKYYMQKEARLYQSLKDEFTQEELEKWQVEILPSNIVRFKSPDVLFQRGSSDLKPLFQTILEQFFPRYISVLTSSQEFQNFIDEVRVEGHTDSSWNNSEFDSYLKNLNLSQDRSREVLNYIVKLDEVRYQFHWLKKVFRANGLANSRTLDENGEFTDVSTLKEDEEKSRRVEFRIMTKSREALQQFERFRIEQLQKEGKI